MRRLVIVVMALAVLSACGPSVRQGAGFTQGDAVFVTVRRGDSVWDIARRHGVPMDDIIALNDLSPPYLLQIGQRLAIRGRLPDAPQPGEANTYTVRSGDSLSVIAERTGTRTADLARLNRIGSPYIIYPGQTLRLPPRRMASRSSGSRPPSTNNASPARPAPVEPVQRVSTAREGTFRWPVSGPVLSTFGPKQGGLYNDGINIGAARGTPVLAARNGRVVYAGNELRGYGNLILVRHDDGLVTAYAHLDSFLVRRDQQLRQGEALGTVGNTGIAGPPQLHFEIRRGSDPLDPMLFLAVEGS